MGGRSSRMGRDKASLPFRGGVLVQHVANAVQQAAGSVVLVGSPGKLGAVGYPILPDIYPGEGPLGGILTVLQHSRADWNLIVACDMPALTADFLGGLLCAAEASEADAFVPRGPSSRLEPLCAVYHQRSRGALYQAFAEGTRKITRAFAALRIAEIRIDEIMPLQNVNTPEDWAAYGAE